MPVSAGQNVSLKFCRVTQAPRVSYKTKGCGQGWCLGCHIWWGGETPDDPKASDCREAISLREAIWSADNGLSLCNSNGFRGTVFELFHALWVKDWQQLAYFWHSGVSLHQRKSVRLQVKLKAVMKWHLAICAVLSEINDVRHDINDRYELQWVKCFAKTQWNCSFAVFSVAMESANRIRCKTECSGPWSAALLCSVKKWHSKAFGSLGFGTCAQREASDDDVLAMTTAEPLNPTGSRIHKSDPNLRFSLQPGCV